jgi:hypothetical protein
VNWCNASSSRDVAHSFRTEAAEAAMQTLAQDPEMLVGAGTVVRPYAMLRVSREQLLTDATARCASADDFASLLRSQSVAEPRSMLGLGGRSAERSCAVSSWSTSNACLSASPCGFTRMKTLITASGEEEHSVGSLDH